MAIGLVAAYGLLLSALLPAFAATGDPLQSYLAAHLCGPGDSSSNGKAPANPVEHRHDCQLCGPSCAMGGHAPLAALPDAPAAIAPVLVATDLPVRAGGDAPAPSSRYPSDTVSQGPPQAA